ncbi:MAG: hypothetical protein OXR07_03090, partial [Nitrospira sp.]|nr:hypothetical protein [Nitrospira sp.]
PDRCGLPMDSCFRRNDGGGPLPSRPTCAGYHARDTPDHTPGTSLTLAARCLLALPSRRCLPHPHRAIIRIVHRKTC